ncbi:hypothetical protein T492DRAFT_887344 [Pavlovales sp. CCMP2436]|nr:hypothetical protein T492DRAFT_887344 [Pavlovales sp. CCMP2436]
MPPQQGRAGTKHIDAGGPETARAKMLAVAFESSPTLVAMLDSANMIVMVNPTFEQQMGPLFKLAHSPFNAAAADQKSNDTLTAALDRAHASGGTVKIKDCNMLTVVGFPTSKHIDWSFRQGMDGLLCAVGEMVTEVDEEQREKDQDLMDFFQNAPIAMHWLSGTGQILRCNNTELRVLGYTAEDVPVRFRSKDGRIVPLLIDSNVNYTNAGTPTQAFNHTRCFIRDDTGRINEALMVEVLRTHKLFDVSLF